MKKLFLIGFVLMTTQGFSQTFMSSLWSRLHFGLKAGANYSDFRDADFDTEGLVGFHAGGIVAFDITKNFMVQEEFLFSTQGAKVKKDLFGKEDLQISYITIPILLRYRTNMGLYIEAGPQAGMLIADVKDTSYDKFADKVDIGLAGGLGFRFGSHVELGARYYYGFTDVGKFDSPVITKSFKNNTAQVSLSYIF